MSRAALQATRSTLSKWFSFQVVVTVLLFVIFFFSQGTGFAISVLQGAALCIVPQFLFACWWFIYFKASATQRLIKIFYMGELAKLLLTAVLFVLMLQWLKINILACLIGFFSAHMAFGLAPLVQKK